MLLWGGDRYDLPMPGDYDGDGRTDLAVVGIEKGRWRVKGLLTKEIAVVPDGMPVYGDFDGDGLLEVGVFGPAGVMWFLEEEEFKFHQKFDIPLVRGR